MFMYIWLISIGLTLICSISNVCSKKCDHDWQCNISQECCLGDCVAHFDYCPECKVDSDCKNEETCSYGACKYSATTWYPPTDECIWDSDCRTGHSCYNGRCERDYDYGDSGGSFWSGSRMIGIIFFVAVTTVLSCLYHMCKRARKQPVHAPPPMQNARTTSGPSANEATHVEMHSGSAFSHNNTVIDVDENSPPPPPLPADGPPPYSSLELQRQGNNEDEPELPPPPSYDEAVRNSTRGLV